MPRPIATMSDKQIDDEFRNYERYRTSPDVARRRLFERNRARYEELLAARESLTGFRLETSLEVIRKAAQERRFISYKELADANGVDWKIAYFTINRHLGDLISFSHERDGILISAIIVNKENLETGRMQEKTLTGFALAAEAMGYQFSRAEAFLAAQQEAVFAHYAPS